MDPPPTNTDTHADPPTSGAEAEDADNDGFPTLSAQDLSRGLMLTATLTEYVRQKVERLDSRNKDRLRRIERRLDAGIEQRLDALEGRVQEQEEYIEGLTMDLRDLWDVVEEIEGRGDDSEIMYVKYCKCCGERISKTNPAWHANGKVRVGECVPVKRLVGNK